MFFKHETHPQLFNSPVESDFKILTADGHVFHAHLKVLAQLTNFFTNAVAPLSDNVEKVVYIPEQSEEVVNILLQYAYCGEDALNSAIHRVLTLIGEYHDVEEDGVEFMKMFMTFVLDMFFACSIRGFDGEIGV